ncbi:MAG: transcriptional regulator, partial [Deltaproteobacteria bacterium HGW-Deltaproteobacteria-20]
MDFLTAMGQSTLFKGLGAEELAQLERTSEPRQYDKGDLLFGEGKEGVGFYVVVTGQVKVFKMSFDGREQILHILGPGDPLGEVPVFAGMNYPANAQALGKS